MSVQSTQSYAKSLREELLCPVLLVPLSEAVTLVPCAHKMQQVVAEKIFGITDGGWQVKSNKPCPMCCISVQGYMVDHSTRNIVKLLFELPENELNAILVNMKNHLAEKCMTVEKDVQLNKIPYPGKPARFVHNSGNWNLFDSDRDLCRSMVFLSSTKDSFLKEFLLLGYNDGKVKILIRFSEKSQAAAYLKQFDIILSSMDQHTESYKSGNHDQLKLIFNIIAENNEIPASHFEKIRDIVAKGTH